MLRDITLGQYYPAVRLDPAVCLYASFFHSCSAEIVMATAPARTSRAAAHAVTVYILSIMPADISTGGADVIARPACIVCQFVSADIRRGLSARWRTG